MKIQKKGEKYVTTDRFEVNSIGYNANREIVSLEIVNASGEVVFRKNGAAGKKPTYLVPEDFDRLEKELNRTGVELDTVLERYGLSDIGQLTPEIYEKAMKSLKRSRSKAA